MKAKPTFQGVGLLILLTTLSSTSFLNAARSVPLHYRPTAGQTNVYHVQIETRGENGNDILAGNLLLIPKAGPSNLITITLRGTLNARRDHSRPMMGGYSPPRLPSPVFLNEGCELQIDVRGRILRSAGDQPLPVPLGSIGQLLLETMPSGGERRWETTELLGVMDDPLNLGPSRAFLFGPPYSMPYYGGMNPRTSQTVLTAERRGNCELETSEPDVVKIRKSSNIKTELRNGADPRMEGSTEGSLILDRESGFLRSAEVQFKSTVNTDVVTRRTTGSVQVKLLEGTERSAALEAFQGISTPARKLVSTDVEKLLEEAKSSDVNLQRQAASKLQNAEIPNPPAELLNVATNWISVDDSSLKMAGARILADYGTEEHLPLLLKLLRQNDMMTRSSVIRGLGRLKDPSAAEPLAGLIARGSDTYEASQALARLGPSAEETTLGLLREKHLETLRSACNVLKQIGSAKSVEPLRELMLDPDQSLSSSAAEAIRSIQARE